MREVLFSVELIYFSFICTYFKGDHGTSYTYIRILCLCLHRILPLLPHHLDLHTGMIGNS